MHQNPENIQNILKVSKEIVPINFKDVVHATTKKSVFTLDFNSKEDMELLNILYNSAREFVQSWERRRQRFQGGRINEVGRAIEDAFVQELKKTNLKAEFLSKSGYPDIKLIDKYDRVTYLESKAVSKGWDSSFRSFYFTNGNKIKNDARHLLIAWKLAEERDKYWQVLGFKLCDISRLKMNIKIEFNSSNKYLYTDELIVRDYS
jgi:hypothetical protein